MGIETSPGQTTTGSKDNIAFDRTIDWIIGVSLGIVGILVTLGGAGLYTGVNRSDIAELINDSEFQSGTLTEAEAIDAMVALAQWSGLGLVVAGILLVLLGIAVVSVHGRVRKQNQKTPRWILGVAGALVGSILSFIPLSPMIGGGTAGYFDPDQNASGLRSGMLAGLFAVLPLLVVAVFAGVGLFVGVPSEVAITVVPVLGIVILFSLIYTIGLSAIGGYLGVWARNR